MHSSEPNEIGSAAPPRTEVASLSGRSGVRGSRLQLAVVTAIASKVTSVGVQLLALPLAIRALGTHQFAVYAMMAAAAGWLTMASVGVGPSVTIRVARCKGNHRRESHLLLSGLIPVSIASLVAGTAFLAASWLLPVAVIFGEQSISDETEVRLGLTLLAAMLVIQAIASVIESAQVGYQEAHVQNLRGLTGNLLTLAAVACVALWRPTLLALIVAANGPGVVARLVNVALFLQRRKYLMAHASTWSPRESWDLVRDGISFALAGGLGAFLTIQAPVVFVGRAVHASEAASFAASMNLFVVASGLVTMVMTPLWPAIADAMVHRDALWLRASYRHLLILGLGYAFAVAAVVGLFGQVIMRYWVGAGIAMTPGLSAAWAIAFVCHVWEYLHYMWLTGAGRISSSSMAYIARALCSSLLIVFFVDRWGTSVPFLAFATAVCVSTGWLFRGMYRRTLRSIAPGTA